MPRIAIASGSAYLLGQFLDIAVFNRLRRQAWWQAPLFGSLIGSMLDTVIFFSFAFAPLFVDLRTERPNSRSAALPISASSLLKRHAGFPGRWAISVGQADGRIGDAAALWRADERAAANAGGRRPLIRSQAGDTLAAVAGLPRLYCRGEQPMTRLKAVLKAASDS
jgi:hypothetical protein